MSRGVGDVRRRARTVVVRDQAAAGRRLGHRDGLAGQQFLHGLFEFAPRRFAPLVRVTVAVVDLAVIADGPQPIEDEDLGRAASRRTGGRPAARRRSARGRRP